MKGKVIMNKRRIEHDLVPRTPMQPEDGKVTLYPLTKWELLDALGRYDPALLVLLGPTIDNKTTIAALLREWQPLADESCPTVRSAHNVPSRIYGFGPFLGRGGKTVAMGLDTYDSFNPDVCAIVSGLECRSKNQKRIHRKQYVPKLISVRSRR